MKQLVIIFGMVVLSSCGDKTAESEESKSNDKQEVKDIPDDQKITRHHYSKNTESASFWQPRPISSTSFNNRSGSQYDIITHEPLSPDRQQPQSSITQVQRANRVKGVAEFADKKAVFAVNLNPAYMRAVA